VDLDHFPDAARLSRRILVLPSHQAVPFAAITWLGRQLLRLGRAPAPPSDLTCDART
jgi:hypothetical protein